MFTHVHYYIRLLFSGNPELELDGSHNRPFKNLNMGSLFTPDSVDVCSLSIQKL